MRNILNTRISLLIAVRVPAVATAVGCTLTHRVGSETRVRDWRHVQAIRVPPLVPAHQDQAIAHPSAVPVLRDAQGHPEHLPSPQRHDRREHRLHDPADGLLPAARLLPHQGAARVHQQVLGPASRRAGCRQPRHADAQRLRHQAAPLVVASFDAHLVPDGRSIASTSSTSSSSAHAV